MRTSESTRSSEGLLGLAVVLERNNCIGTGVITANLQPASRIETRMNRGYKFDDFLGGISRFWREKSDVPDDVRQIISDWEASFPRGSGFEQDINISYSLGTPYIPSFWDDSCVNARRDKFSINIELSYTAKVLTRDRENKRAWLQRRRDIERMGRWEKELSFCDKLIIADPTHMAVWDQRFFVVMNYGSCWSSEVGQAIKYILADPAVENPWLYLRRIYQYLVKDNSKLQSEARGALDHLFCTLLPKEYFSHFIYVPKDYMEVRLAENEAKYRFALSTLLELACRGYVPGLEVKEAVSCLMIGVDYYIDYPEFICDALTHLCPLKHYYWSWLASEVVKIKALV